MEPQKLNLAIRQLWQPFRRRHRLRTHPPPPQLELSNLLQIHSVLVVSGALPNSSLLTRLLLHCLSLPSFPSAYALAVFNQIRLPDAATYNAVITGFKTDPRTAVSLYIRMRREGVFPNKHTFPLLLKSKTLIPLQLFAQVTKFGVSSDRFVANSLISSLANSGYIDYARLVFDEMSDRDDTIACTALMDGFVKNGRALQALELFLDMRILGVGVDEVAAVTALCAVGILGCVWVGRWIHGFYIETGRVARDVYVGSALVDMYSKASCCDDAAKALREMPYRNVVSWNALLAGYVQWNRCTDALLLFREMLVEKVEPNEAILATVLTACANLGALDQGRWIDKYITTHKLKLNSVLGTALIDMYAKCGCIHGAFHVFNDMHSKDIYPWTALIFGLAMNGEATRALTVFSDMLRSGVQPNEVTFLAVLCACSHGGLVNQGREVFASMEGVYGIEPKVDHYGCMVDLLGRAGKLDEAIAVIADMPVEPSAGVWGALFGACMMHRDFELGKSVGRHLIELQPSHGGRYARLANLYCEYRDWEGTAAVRKKMNEEGVEKTPGCSLIEVDGVLHEFLAFDKSHTESENIYCVLNSLTNNRIRGDLEAMDEN